MAESQGPTVTTVSVVFGVITILTMALRLFARIYITRSFGPDDGEPHVRFLGSCINASKASMHEHQLTRPISTHYNRCRMLLHPLVHRLSMTNLLAVAGVGVHHRNYTRYALNFFQTARERELTHCH